MHCGCNLLLHTIAIRIKISSSEHHEYLHLLSRYFCHFCRKWRYFSSKTWRSSRAASLNPNGKKRGRNANTLQLANASHSHSLRSQNRFQNFRNHTNPKPRLAIMSSKQGKITQRNPIYSPYDLCLFQKFQLFSGIWFCQVVKLSLWSSLRPSKKNMMRYVCMYIKCLCFTSSCTRVSARPPCYGLYISI